MRQQRRGLTSSGKRNHLGLTGGAGRPLKEKRLLLSQRIETAFDDGVYIRTDLGPVPDRNLPLIVLDAPNFLKAVLLAKDGTGIALQDVLYQCLLRFPGRVILKHESPYGAFQTAFSEFRKHRHHPPPV